MQRMWNDGRTGTGPPGDDTVDAQLAALFERRMKAVLSVAEYKKAHGLPIFDAAREKVVLDKAEARIGTRPCAPITGTMCRT